MDRTVMNWISSGLCLVLAGFPSALAGPDHRDSCKIEVDIDELDADLFPDGDSWLLRVRYEVDIEDACRGEQLELQLTFEDDDRRVVDTEGRALCEVIPLAIPRSCHGDEQTFAACAEFRLPRGAVCHADDFEVLASVTRAGESCSLDSEDTTAKPHYPVIVVSCPPRVVEVAPVVIEQPVVFVERPVAVVERPVVVASPAVVVHEIPRRVEIVRYHPHVQVEYRRRPNYVRIGARW